MAKQGAKKQVEENQKKLKLLLQVLLISNTLHLAFRVGLWWSSWSRWQAVLLVLTWVLQYVCYSSLVRLAEPVYSYTGELEDGGANLGLSGVTEYYQDLIWVSAFVQIATVCTKWAWLLFLLVPAYAFYLLWKNILLPYFTAPPAEDMPETEAMRRKREKLERKAGRQRVRYTR